MDVVELVSPISISTIGTLLTMNVPSSFVKVPWRMKGVACFGAFSTLLDFVGVVLIEGRIRPVLLELERPLFSDPEPKLRGDIFRDGGVPILVWLFTLRRLKALVFLIWVGGDPVDFALGEEIFSLKTPSFACPLIIFLGLGAIVDLVGGSEGGIVDLFRLLG